MNRTMPLRSIFIAAMLCLVAGVAATQQTKPNVIFILADNVGYGDMGPYGAASCAECRRHAPISLPWRPPPDAISRRTFLYTVALGAHDRAILDPRWTIAGHPARLTQYTLGQSLHHGAVVQERRLCDGHLR